VSGVCSAGLITITQPAAIAGPTFQAVSASGKFLMTLNFYTFAITDLFMAYNLPGQYRAYDSHGFHSRVSKEGTIYLK